MSLPESITVHVLRDAGPVADALVQLILHSRDRGDLSTLPQSTDSAGTVQWSSNDIKAAEAVAKRLLPRDTPSLHKHHLTAVTAVVWGAREIDWARKAAALWGERGEFPEGYTDMLDRGARALDRLGAGDVAVKVSIAGTELPVQGESRIQVRYKPSYEAGLLEGWPLVSDRNS